MEIHRWLLVVRAMGRMLRELYAHPEMGLLHHEMGFSKTLILMQYWRSEDQLLTYAKNKDAAHLPALRDFNRAMGTDGSVSIWHETYSIKAGAYESIYANIPPFGLGKAGKLEKIGGSWGTAAGRLGS